MTELQRQLAKDHGAPDEFAAAVWRAFPEFATRSEAQDAITAYQREWAAAGDQP